MRVPVLVAVVALLLVVVGWGTVPSGATSTCITCPSFPNITTVDADLQSFKASTSASLTSLNDSFQQQQSDFVALSASIVNLQTSVASLTTRNDEQDVRISLLEGQVDELNITQLAIVGRLGTAENTLTQLDNTVTTLGTQVTNLETEANSLESSLNIQIQNLLDLNTTVFSSIAPTLASHATFISLQEDFNTEAVANITDLQSRQLIAEQQILDLQESERILQSNLTNLEDMVLQHQSQIGQLEGLSSLVQQNVTLLLTAQTNQAAEILAIQGEVTTLQGNVSTLSQEQEGFSTALALSQSRISLLEANMTAFELSQAAQDALIAANAEKIQFLESNASSILGRLDTQDLEIQFLQGNLTDLTTTVGVHTVQIADLQGNMTGLEERMVVQELKSDVLTSNITSVSSGLSAVELQTLILQSNITTLFDSLSTFNSELIRQAQQDSVFQSNITELFALFNSLKDAAFDSLDLSANITFLEKLLRETQLLTVYVQGNVTALEEYLSQVELHVANNSARITNLEERVTLEELKSGYFTGNISLLNTTLSNLGSVLSEQQESLQDNAQRLTDAEALEQVLAENVTAHRLLIDELFARFNNQSALLDERFAAELELRNNITAMQTTVNNLITQSTTVDNRITYNDLLIAYLQGNLSAIDDLLNEVIKNRTTVTEITRVVNITFLDESNIFEVVNLSQPIPQFPFPESLPAAEFVVVRRAIDAIWSLFSSALIIFALVGFGLLESGFVRRKNSRDVFLRILLTTAIGSLGFWFLGFPFGFSDGNSVIGASSFWFTDEASVREWLQQLGLGLLSFAVLAGAMAERTSLWVYTVLAPVFFAFLYPISARWLWHEEGFLRELGAIDFGGGLAIHAFGAICSLAAVLLVGQRVGMWDESGKKISPRSSSPLLGSLGFAILWLCWHSVHMYVPSVDLPDGPARTTLLSRSAANAAIAGGTGCFFMALISKFAWKNTWESLSLLNGLRAGMVSISSGLGLVDPWSACIIAVAGVLLYRGVVFLFHRMRVDDAMDFVSIHLTCGVWGMLAVGLFAQEDSLLAIQTASEFTGHGFFLGGGGRLLGIQALSIVCVLAWGFFLVLFFLWLCSLKASLRVSSHAEDQGLDMQWAGEKDDWEVSSDEDSGRSRNAVLEVFGEKGSRAVGANRRSNGPPDRPPPVSLPTSTVRSRSASDASDRSLLHEHHNVASGLSSESDMQAGGPQLATPFHNPGHAPVVLPSSAPKELPELRSPPPYLDGIPSAQSSLTIPASIRGPGNSASRPQPLGSSTESSSSEPTPTLSEASSDDRGIDQKAQGTSRTPSRVQSIWRPKDSLLSSLPPLPVSQLEEPRKVTDLPRLHHPMLTLPQDVKRRLQAKKEEDDGPIRPFGVAPSLPPPPPRGSTTTAASASGSASSSGTPAPRLPALIPPSRRPPPPPPPPT